MEKGAIYPASPSKLKTVNGKADENRDADRWVSNRTNTKAKQPNVR